MDLGSILMEKDCDPWRFRDFNHASSVGTPAIAKPSPNSMVFPTYPDPYGFFQLNSALIPPSHPTGFASGQKRFMVFDRSGDQTSLIYSSFGNQFPYTYPTNDLPPSNGTDVLNGNVNEEMHEDTEEIDALLYSDSDNDYEEEEEASTGHSPMRTTASSMYYAEEDASSAVLQPPAPPAKRRRTDPELVKFDPSLADTASSTHCGEDRKKSKRVKIQETVGVLRRIVPGGKGKDAAGVLDEAIRYLKSLRLKAKGLGVASLK